MKKKIPMIIVSICTLILTIAMTTINMASSDSVWTTVSINPTTITGPPPSINENFTVHINIENVTDLYTYILGLSWNATVLNCLSWTYNTTFFPPDLTVPGTIDNVAGKTEPAYGATFADPPHPNGVNGSGTLADIKFKVVGYGGSWINLTECSMLDSRGIEIPRDLVNGTFVLVKDETPPTIDDVVQSPTLSEVDPSEAVDVTAINVTDNVGVDVVLLRYSTDNITFTNVTMSPVSGTNNYTGQIPGQAAGIYVTYKIFANDTSGNWIEIGPPYAYRVIPEFPPALILPLLMALTLITIMLKKMKLPRKLNK